MEVYQNLLVPALDAGPQKDRPYQSDFYRAGSNAIPRGAREQDVSTHLLFIVVMLQFFYLARLCTYKEIPISIEN